MAASWTNWNGDRFDLTTDEYIFIETYDLWDGLSEFAHQWDIDSDPGAWDMMMECFIPFMTYGDRVFPVPQQVKA